MKKIIILSLLCLILPSLVIANTGKATIINTITGQKMVINIGQHFPSSDWSLLGQKNEPKLGLALPGFLYQVNNLVGTQRTFGNFIASSVNPYMIATTTTVVSGLYGYDTLSINASVKNSSTTGALTFNINPTYSNDANCEDSSDTLVNWFTSYVSTQGATSTVVAASTTTSWKYNIQNLASRCVKFVIYPTHASSTAFVQALTK